MSLNARTHQVCGLPCASSFKCLTKKVDKGEGAKMNPSARIGILKQYFIKD
jgi:hypothetical protein